MKIVKIGGWALGSGTAAVFLSFSFGAGPCNATFTGVMFMLAGLFAITTGLVMLVIGFIIKARTAKTA